MEKHISQHYEQPHLFIFNDRKLVYLLMSKVACSSMNANIAKAYGLKKSLVKLGRYQRDYPWEDAGIKIGIGGLSQESGGQDYFKFAFVRNPFDRLVSCYKDKILAKNKNGESYFEYNYKYYDQYPLQHKMPFEDFVNIVTTVPDHLADRHFKRQFCFIYPPEEKIDFDFIGRFENLVDDWQYIAKKFNFHLDLPHKNASNADIAFKDLYSLELLEKVYSYYEDDIISFGYQKAYEKLREQIIKGDNISKPLTSLKARASKSQTSASIGNRRGSRYSITNRAQKILVKFKRLTRPAKIKN